MRKWMWVLAGALVLALAASPVLASGGGGRLWARNGAGLDQLGVQLRDRTCAELGVTPEQFRQAWQRAATAIVDELQTQGKLTAQQADRIRQHIQQGNPDLWGMPRVGGKGVRGAMGIHMQAGRLALDELAGFLGMTPEDFWAALRSGKSVAQVAEERGKTRQEVIDFLTAKVKERLDEAVAAGKITQERADQVMATFQARLPQMLDFVRNCTGCPSGVPGSGMGGGRGGRWQRGGQGPQAPQPQAPQPQAPQSGGL
ncbi:MAG: hypothetical protein QME70_03800 [Bacillota bacterium]|nr:hypothetical protein [Bacillota bacterium]